MTGAQPPSDIVSATGSALPIAGERHTLEPFIERNWRFIHALATAGLDAAALAIALVLCRAWVDMGSPAHESRPVHVALVGAPLLFLGFCAIFGLYRRSYSATHASQARAAAKGCAFGGATLTSALLVGGETDLLAPVALWLAGIAPVVLATFRFGWQQIRRTLQAHGWAIEKAVLVLAGDEPEKSPGWLQALRPLGYDVIGQVRQDLRDPGDFLHEVDRHVGRTGARAILLPTIELVANGYAGLVPYAQVAGLKIKLFSPDIHRILGRAFVHDVAGITIESPVRFKIVRLRHAAKRVFDIVGASLLFLLASPLFLLVAVALKLESRGPVFFTQTRALSQHSSRFELYKFRSMHSQADAFKASLRAANESSGALFKIKNDPRVTRVGKIIRRFSIDELPQVLNVLKGDMSLVGPRPLPVQDFEQLQDAESMDGYYERRARLKPGITGLWQICGRSELGFREMVLLDLYYAENHTTFVDLEILLHSIPVVLTGRGAY